MPRKIPGVSPVARAKVNAFKILGQAAAHLRKPRKSKRIKTEVENL